MTRTIKVDMVLWFS